jgi:hypothetical protein
MNFYITYNDAPSGIFSSQVIDVVKFLNIEVKQKVKLISFISIRGFLNNRKKIKKQIPDAIILPMYPKMINWEKNLFLLNLLCTLYKPKILIGRSVIATKLSLLIRDKKKNCKKVVYDGRGAIAAEWKEYNVVTDQRLVEKIDAFEKEVILNSDYRISVSAKLIEFWKKMFQYVSDKHIVIPCNINSIFENIEISKNSISQIRNELYFNSDDFVFVYSGSLAGWQSFDLLKEFLRPILAKNDKCKVLFLSEFDKNIENLKKEFSNQVFSKHVSPYKVPYYLVACDYGLLIREQSITNKVASPVKFAEYLCCGLGIVISDNLGDYTNFVKQYKCGSLYSEFNFNRLDKVNLKKLSLTYFTKKAHLHLYKKLFC